MSNAICPSCWGTKAISQTKSSQRADASDPYITQIANPCLVCKGNGTVLDQQLTEHFMLSEMLNSSIAARQGIDNDPSSFIISDLKFVCSTLLEPIRTKFGPIHIDSGYRSEELNRKVGGSSTSAHCYGMAADINIQGHTRKEVVEWIMDNIPSYDQVIFEGTWIHIAHNPKGASYNRKQNLMMFAGKYYPFDPNDPRITT